MRPRVSIIVPIYNVERYLGRCLDSLLSQTFRDIEIIAINDGSTDESGEVLKKYAAKDNRIVFVEKENGGVSSARNKGLELATGEYIGFVDPDDWVDPEMYDKMYTTAVEDKADIVMCTYVREFGNYTKEKIFNLPEKVCYCGNEVQTKVMRRLVGPLHEEVANPEYLDAWGTVWSKLYRTDIIKGNNLRFIDLQIVGTNEDSLFNIHAFFHTKVFSFINQPFYHYWRVNSTSVTTGYKPQLIDQWFKLYGIMESFIQEKDLQQDFLNALNNRICLNILGLGLNTISSSNTSTVMKKINKLGTILNDNRIKCSFKQLEMKYFPFVWRAFYFCAKLRFTLGFFFMLVAIDWLRKAIR